MIERNILFVGLRQLHSEKKKKDYYMVDYVDRSNNLPKTDYIKLEEFSRLAGKKLKSYSEVIGLFNLNEYDKAYLCDVK